MAFDEERLFVTLEARVTEFERRMKAAEKRGTATYNSLKRNSASATKAMEADMVRSTGRINQALASTSAQIGKFQGAVGGLRGGPIVAGITAAAAALLAAGKAANTAAAQIAQIGDEAQRAGVSAREFQQWKFVAEQNRIPIDAMIDGLKELNLRADEFVVTGGGPAAEAFERMGYTADELRQKLKDPSALLLEIIGRLGDLDAAAQIRIADEVFGGTAGERFVELIDQGEAGIRRTMERAEELGVVMDDDLIRKADDLNRMFQTVATTVGTTLKAAIVEAAIALVDFINSFRSFEAQRSQALEGQVNDVIRRRAKLVERQKALQSGEGLTDNARNLGFGPDSAATKHEIADLQTQIDTLTAEEDEIIGVLQSRTTYTAPPPPAAPSVPSSGGTRPLARPASVTPSGSGGAGGGGGGRAPTPDELEREIAAIVKRTEAIKAGTAAQEGINPLLDDYGYATEKAATAQELLAAAQAAGVQLTPELRAQIDALAHGYAEASAEAKRLDEAQADVVRRAEETAALKRDIVGGLVRGLREGKDAADLLAESLTKVADHLLDIALQQMFKPTAAPVGSTGGGFLGFLGGLLGGFGFASGGYTGPGGKHDPAGIVHAGEYVFSKRAVDRLGVGRLEAMHRAAKRGYAEGGSVGGAAAPAAPAVNAKIVNVLDPKEVVSAALATEDGQRVIINFMSANSRRINAALGS